MNMNRASCAAAIAMALMVVLAPMDVQAQGGPKVNDTVFSTDAIKRVTAVTRVFGRGQSVVGAIVEFAEPLKAGAVQPKDFAVDGRTIQTVRVTGSPDPDAPEADGRFVVIALDPSDKDAAVFGPGLD